MIYTKLLDEIAEHMEQELPRECCGFIGTKNGITKYYPCTNIATDIEDFIIKPEEVEYFEDTGGEILFIVHSHPRSSTEPSSADLIGIKEHGVPWIIMDKNKNISVTPAPSNSLEGREFRWGTSDCYTLITDYYKSKLGISCGEIKRGNPQWWLEYGTRFEETYKEAGFVLAHDVQVHDMLVMSINSPNPNHFAIFLGNNYILHHLEGRVSCIEPMNKLYSNSIVCVLRRKELV